MHDTIREFSLAKPSWVMCQYIILYKYGEWYSRALLVSFYFSFFSILGAFCNKIIILLALVSYHVTFSYPTGAREIIVKYTNQEHWKTRTHRTYHLTRILRRFLVLPPPRRNPQFRIGMNVKESYHFVLVFRKVISDVWRLYLGEGSFTRIEVRTRVVCTHSFSFRIKKQNIMQRLNKYIFFLLPVNWMWVHIQFN